MRSRAECDATWPEECIGHDCRKHARGVQLPRYEVSWFTPKPGHMGGQCQCDGLLSGNPEGSCLDYHARVFPSLPLARAFARKIVEAWCDPEVWTLDYDDVDRSWCRRDWGDADSHEYVAPNPAAPP